MQEYHDEIKKIMDFELINNSGSLQSLQDLINEDTNISFHGNLSNESELSAQSVLDVAAHQTKYISQLEKEVLFLRDELQKTKESIIKVIAENDSLRKNSNQVYVDSLNDQLQKLSDENTFTEREQEESLAKSENQMWPKWQAELERIRSMYQSVSKRLESQTEYFRSELFKKKEEVENLKTKLHGMETDLSIKPNDRSMQPSLCVNCANKEAVMLSNSSVINESTKIAHLNQEKEEMCYHIAELQQKLKESELREDESHDQVKKSVLLVEQAQFEKTEVEAENYHLKRNLKRGEERTKELILEYKENLKKERDTVTEEWSKRLSLLQDKLNQVNDENVQLDVKIQQSELEKKKVLDELMKTKDQLTELQHEMNKVKESMKMEISQLRSERESSNKQIQTFLNDKGQFNRLHKQEVDSLQQKIEMTERKLVVTERKLIESNDQCVQLSRTVAALEKQANNAIISKQTVERSRTDDVKTLNKEAKIKEESLKSQLRTMQEENVERMQEMDMIITSQKSVIDRIKEECESLTNKLEQISKSSWVEKNNWLEEKAFLSSNLEITLDKLSVLESDQKQRLDAETRLKQQLIKSEETGKRSSQQVYELIQKQMLIDQERQHLRGEVEFLHNELISLNISKDKSFSRL